jgi:WXXGXW repeat (2 copies)
MRRLCSVIWLAVALLTVPISASAQVICISNASPPPELPVYEQPPIPEPGYIWTPGYWAGGPYGYFWVPGTWVQPPTVGLLWTPGYWGWRDGIYVWNAGYWGPHIGFYGGVNYGFGYGGVGYEGGRWENGVFAYNRTVNNFGSVTINNVYEKTVVVDPGAARVSFNGGSGGTAVRPTPEQEAIAHEQHVAAIPAQLQHERTASADKALLASENHGQPTVAATTKPNEFAGKGVVAARQVEPAVTTPATRPTGTTAVAPNPTGSKAVEKEEQSGKNQTMLNGGAPTKLPNTETKSPNAATSRQPHPDHPGQAAIKPALPPPPSPQGEQPAQATIKPTPAPSSPPHTEHPEQAGIKPAPSPAAVPNAAEPSQAGNKPVTTPQPPSAAPVAAKPSPPPNKPSCPPGKTPAEVNGHSVCR